MTKIKPCNSQWKQLLHDPISSSTLTMRRIRMWHCNSKCSFWSTKLWKRSRKDRNLQTSMTKCSTPCHLLTSVLKSLRTTSYTCSTSWRGMETRVDSSISSRLSNSTSWRANSSRTVSKLRIMIPRRHVKLPKKRNKRLSYCKNKDRIAKIV